jgi:tetratricopeptide (TPR) repeat protein
MYRKLFKLNLAVILLATLTLNAADSPLEKARSESKSGNYKQAAHYYVSAVMEAESKAKGSGKEIMKELAEMYRDAGVEIGLKARKEKKIKLYQQSISYLKKASLYYPKMTNRCNEYIQKFEKEAKALAYRNETSLETIDPGAAKRKEDIAILIRQGKTLMADHQYEKAMEKFESVLLLDPYNEKTISELRKLWNASFEAARQRRDLTLKERKSESEWKNVSPILPQDDSDQTKAENQPGEELPPLIEKMQATNIPEINFVDIEPEKAFKYLEEKGGISFKFRGVDIKSKELPLVTFKAKNISLDQALSSICRGLKLSFIPEATSIIITPKNN